MYEINGGGDYLAVPDTVEAAGTCIAFAALVAQATVTIVVGLAPYRNTKITLQNAPCCELKKVDEDQH